MKIEASYETAPLTAPRHPSLRLTGPTRTHRPASPRIPSATLACPPLPDATGVDWSRIVRGVQAGNSEAVAELYCASEPLRSQWCRAFSDRGDKFLRDDAMQEAFLGLLQAARRYNFRDSAFTTFARVYVRSALSACFRSNCHAVSRPKGYYRDANRLHDFLGANAEAHAWTDSQLCDALGWTLPRLNKARNVYHREIRLDEPSHDFERLFEAERAADPTLPLHEAACDDRTLLLRRALKRLAPRQRAILRARFYQDAPTRYTEIGAALGLSGERARQILNDAFKQIRQFIQLHENAQSVRTARGVSCAHA